MITNILANLCKGTRRMQYIAVLIASLGVSTTQMYLTWPGPVIPKLLAQDSPFDKPITTADKSWIVSCILLAGLPLAFTFHLTVGRFARKQVLQTASVVLFVPWIIIIFGNHVAYVYVARVIAGILLGGTVSTAAMYCSEVADADIRGRLGTSYGIMKLSGSIVVLTVGPFVSYQVLGIICAIVPFTFFCLLFFIPESPYSLIKMNRLTDAREAVRNLSGSSDEVEIDIRMKAIVAFVSTAEKPLTFLQVIKKKVYMKAIAIIVALISVEYLSGYFAILSYQQKIIESTRSSLSPELSSIVFGLIQIPAAVLSAFLIDLLGRKVILYIGNIGCLIAVLAEAVYFYIQDYLQEDTSSINWIPTTGLVLYLVFHAIHSSVPYILLGEFFADNMKNVATTFFNGFGITAVFIVTQTFEPMRLAWGVYTVFFIYAGFTVLTILVTALFLIETKNKTFEEIDQTIYKSR